MKRIHKPHKVGILAMLAALLGIGACGEINEDDPNNGGEMMVMYGSPTAYYEVKGKVKGPDGKPVQGIQVTVESRRQSDGRYYYYPIEEPVTTDSEGKWQRNAGHYPSTSLKVVYKDIDGAANGGEFADDSVFVDITVVKDEKKAKENPWYMGDVKVDVPTVKLKKK